MLFAAGNMLFVTINVLFVTVDMLFAADAMLFATINVLFVANNTLTAAAAKLFWQTTRFLRQKKIFSADELLFAAVNMCSEAFPAEKWREFLENGYKLVGAKTMCFLQQRRRAKAKKRAGNSCSSLCAGAKHLLPLSASLECCLDERYFAPAARNLRLTQVSLSCL